MTVHFVTHIAMTMLSSIRMTVVVAALRFDDYRSTIITLVTMAGFFSNLVHIIVSGVCMTAVNLMHQVRRNTLTWSQTRMNWRRRSNRPHAEYYHRKK
ncbi:MAG: hypothetical protein AAF423_13770 [Pseudomonadota bacterium]